MKNKLGKRENLREYHENGKLAYEFVVSNDYPYERTFDDQGRQTSYKNSDGFSWKRIYNKNGTFEQINL